MVNTMLNNSKAVSLYLDNKVYRGLIALIGKEMLENNRKVSLNQFVSDILKSYINYTGIKIEEVEEIQGKVNLDKAKKVLNGHPKPTKAIAMHWIESLSKYPEDNPEVKEVMEAFKAIFNKELTQGKTISEV